MGFRLPRLSLVVILLALITAYGYFFGPRRSDTSTRSSISSVSISGASSIKGPYFSDQNRIADRIIAAINHTRHTLDIAVYSITQPEITAAIEAAHRRGIEVRVLSDEEQSFDRHSEIGYLKTSGVPVRLIGGYRGQRSLMHNKFAIFDGNLVETGSFNWTTSANSYNFENAIFIADPEVSVRYEKEFDHIWALSH